MAPQAKKKVGKPPPFELDRSIDRHTARLMATAATAAINPAIGKRACFMTSLRESHTRTIAAYTLAGTTNAARYSRVSIASASESPSNDSVEGLIRSLRPSR